MSDVYDNPPNGAPIVLDGWNLAELDTGHWPMFSVPSELAAVLHDAAVKSTA